MSPRDAWGWALVGSIFGLALFMLAAAGVLR